VVQLGCDRADLGPEFRSWLADFVTNRLDGPMPADPIQP
jgi:hypothetical protein